ncbi:MAG: hypothetical protein QOK22_1424 [Gaiellaceae bacterium]|nr:hypothetical protein [Gaiellaceae bacterium]
MNLEGSSNGLGIAQLRSCLIETLGELGLDAIGRRRLRREPSLRRGDLRLQRVGARGDVRKAMLKVVTRLRGGRKNSKTLLCRLQGGHKADRSALLSLELALELLADGLGHRRSPTKLVHDRDARLEVFLEQGGLLGRLPQLLFELGVRRLPLCNHLLCLCMSCLPRSQIGLARRRCSVQLGELTLERAHTLRFPGQSLLELCSKSDESIVRLDKAFCFLGGELELFTHGARRALGLGRLLLLPSGGAHDGPGHCRRLTDSRAQRRWVEGARLEQRRAKPGREAVLGLEDAARLRGECLRDKGGGHEPSGDENRPELVAGDLLLLESSRELVLCDQSSIDEKRPKGLTSPCVVARFSLYCHALSVLVAAVPPYHP